MDRTKFLGASEAGAVLGLSPYRSPFKVWQEKTGQIVPDPPGIPMRAGNALESLVLDLFSEQTGKTVGDRQAEFVDKSNPFLVCHVDGLAEDAVIEAKTTGSDHGWGKEGTDEIPRVYLAQVVMQMYLSGAKMAWVPVLIGREDFRIYKVERDEELENLIIPRLVDFWQNHVIPVIPPDSMTLEDVRERFGREEIGIKEATEEVAQACFRLEDLKRDIKTLEEEKEKCEVLILGSMGTAAELTYNGRVLATWKSQTTKRLNTARLKELYPEAVEACTGETESRVFRLKKSKEK